MHNSMCTSMHITLLVQCITLLRADSGEDLEEEEEEEEGGEVEGLEVAEEETVT